MAIAETDIHIHYPASVEDSLELYDDLRQHAGLTHEQAVETVGYAADMELARCNQTGPLAAFIMRSEDFLAPFDYKQDLERYHNGALIALEERDEL